MASKHKRGFTLIELLVVISIISALSTVVLSALNSARAKARDARRKEDLHNIYNALATYYTTYGCLPIVTPGSTSTCTGAGAYAEANGGGWDYSSQGGFLTFLVNSGQTNKVPVDPTNDGVGDVVYTGTGYAYGYYCYPSSYGAAPNSLTLNAKLETVAGVYYYPRQNEPGFNCI